MFNFVNNNVPQITKAETVIQPKSNPINDGPIETKGINLDDQKTAVPHLTKASATDLDKISNLEIQFALVVQDLYADNVYK
jgi:hypothetical protein